MNKISLKTQVAGSAGFCFGVRRAIRMALELSAGEQPVYMLGDLVHNEAVIQDLAAAGIKKIKRLRRGQGGILLIRAHGAARAVVERARSYGYEVVDATCPMVQEIHHIVRDCEQRGVSVIVIGDRQHDEVQGIIGQLNKRAFVLVPGGRIPWKALRSAGPLAAVVQSTQDMDQVKALIDCLDEGGLDVEFHNTICQPTRLKQAEIKKIPADSDLVLVIGSRTSANTRRLYELALARNPNTHWIQSASDFKPAWLRGVKTVGIAAGASTPHAIIQAVVAHIQKTINP